MEAVRHIRGKMRHVLSSQGVLSMSAQKHGLQAVLGDGSRIHPQLVFGRAGVVLRIAEGDLGKRFQERIRRLALQKIPSEFALFVPAVADDFEICQTSLRSFRHRA